MVQYSPRSFAKGSRDIMSVCEFSTFVDRLNFFALSQVGHPSIGFFPVYAHRDDILHSVELRPHERYGNFCEPKSSILKKPFG